jgi:predicted TIM-barrel fold metal-dependent hydrolase
VQFPSRDVNKALKVMDRNGISTSMISISGPGVYFKDTNAALNFATDLARETNEICAGLIEDHPERFGAFATLPLPDIDAALEELKHALEVLKLDGVVLLSNYDGYYLAIHALTGCFSSSIAKKRWCSFTLPRLQALRDRTLGFLRL